jgi:hypothetical protein
VDYEVVIIANPDDAALTDVYLQDPETREMTFFATISDVEREYGFGYQYLNGTLYYVKRTGDVNTDNWMDELWRIDQQGNEGMLYASRGLTFRVSPNGQMIAADYEVNPESMFKGLLFLDSNGQILQQIAFSEIDQNLLIDLNAWSDDSAFFWAGFSWGPNTSFFARVDVTSGTYALYDVSAFAPQMAEADLNPNTGVLVYSDMPVFFEIMGAQEFLVSQQPVALYLYDFNDASTTTLATSISKAFHPEWLSLGQLEYDDPDSNGRVRYDLDTGSTTLIPSAEPELAVPSPKVIPPEFMDSMQTLLDTGIPVMLPVEFQPVQEGMPAIYPYIYTAIDGEYEMSLDYGADCQGTGYCHMGSLAARRIGATGPAAGTIMPFFGAQIDGMTQLEGNIPAYFVASQCGANCSDAKLFWIYNGFEYSVGGEAASMEQLIPIANAMLSNSLP